MFSNSYGQPLFWHQILNSFLRRFWLWRCGLFCDRGVGDGSGNGALVGGIMTESNWWEDLVLLGMEVMVWVVITGMTATGQLKHWQGQNSVAQIDSMIIQVWTPGNQKYQTRTFQLNHTHCTAGNTRENKWRGKTLLLNIKEATTLENKTFVSIGAVTKNVNVQLKSHPAKDSQNPQLTFGSEKERELYLLSSHTIPQLRGDRDVTISVYLSPKVFVGKMINNWISDWASITRGNEVKLLSADAVCSGKYCCPNFDLLHQSQQCKGPSIADKHHAFI